MKGQLFIFLSFFIKITKFLYNDTKIRIFYKNMRF